MSLSTDAPRQPELRPVRAVLFDFAETLFTPETPRQKVDGAVLRLGRGPLEESESDRIVGLISDAFAAPDYQPLRDAQDISREDYRAAIMTAFVVADTVVEGLAEAMYERVADPACWIPFADTRPTLESLRAHGLLVGVVSNIGFDIRTVFAHYGLDHLVETFALSFEHGIIKPDPALFEVATAALGVDPTETIMVGDNIADAGAVLAGMRVYLLPPVAPGAPRRLSEVVKVCIGPDMDASH
jgi:FMN phosphatase YigB (HAD superfamily)